MCQSPSQHTINIYYHYSEDPPLRSFNCFTGVKVLSLLSLLQGESDDCLIRLAKKDNVIPK